MQRSSLLLSLPPLSTHSQKRQRKATHSDTPSIFRDKKKLLQEIELGIGDLQKRIEEEKSAKKDEQASATKRNEVGR